MRLAAPQRLSHFAAFLQQLRNGTAGIDFPFPIPLHPEHLNDAGVLRVQACVSPHNPDSNMEQVSVRLYTSNMGTENTRSGVEYDTWLRVKAGTIAARSVLLTRRSLASSRASRARSFRT